MLRSFKILAVADVHMSNKLPYAKPTANGLTDRLEDQMALWEQIRKVAKEEEVMAVFVLGDLFDKSLVDAVTLTATVQAIVGLGVDVYILPGNHDANSIRGGRFTVEAFGAMNRPGIHVIGENPGQHVEIEIKKGNWNLWPVAFKPVEEMREEIKAIQKKLDARKYHALLLHGSVLDSKHLGWICDDGLDPKEICDGFEAVLAGHFHDPQTFGLNGRYLGAPMHHNFGDAGREAGFWIVDFQEGGMLSYDFHPSNAPRFHVCSSLKEHHDAVSGDYLRFQLEATHARWAKIKPKAQAHCEALKAKGIKADFKHKPVYHHESRLAKSSIGKKETVSMEEALGEYIEASGVVTTGLDEKRLKEMGTEILGRARVERGIA